MIRKTSLNCYGSKTQCCDYIVQETKHKIYEIMKIVCMIFFGIKLCACAFDDVFKDKFLKYFNFFF